MTNPYVARIKAFTEGKDPVAMQREMPSILTGLIQGVPEKELRRSPAPGKWSVNEIIAHLADSELVSVWRYRQMIEFNDGPLTPYDQDKWASLGKHNLRLSCPSDSPCAYVCCSSSSGSPVVPTPLPAQ